MKISYLGQSCFYIKSNSGIRIVTDPFGGVPGLKMPEVDADIVTVSHSHFDHNNVNAIGGNYLLADKPIETEVNGISIKGIESFHDSLRGHLRGKNIIFIIKIDDITICHLGDLGHALSDKQIEAIGKPDILFAPVGEIFTFTVDDAVTTMNQLKPVITIPMHYKVSQRGFGIKRVDKFLSAAGDYKKADAKEIEINRENIEDYRGVFVMKI